MSARILLTVSGTIAPETVDLVAQGLLPRRDYVVLARACGADIVDVAAARQALGGLGSLLYRIGGPGVLLAWFCFTQRRRYAAIFTDGEQVGIPLALLFAVGGRRRPAHVMIVHRLTPPKKAIFFTHFGVQRWIDRFFVYATAQQQALVQRWGVSPDRVILTPFMVDSAFFRPDAVVAQPGVRPQICSAGLEWRDYPTLMDAVRDLAIDVTIAAASPWSRRPDSTAAAAVPANVTIKRLAQYDLRQLYADSAFVVMPLYDVDFQAGVTAILEAMAMGKAVICTRTIGQTDVVIDGETGIYVPPDDPSALRRAIVYLLEHPAEAERMGRAGRRRVETLMNLDHYARRLAGYVRAAVYPNDSDRASVVTDPNSAEVA